MPDFAIRATCSSTLCTLTDAIFRAGSAEHVVHQFSQAIGLPDDDPGVLGKIRAVEFAVEQLGSAPDAAQGVLDFVRKPADEFGRGFLDIDQAVVQVDAQQPVQRLHLDEQVSPVDGNHGEIDHEFLPARQEEVLLPQGERPFVGRPAGRVAENVARVLEQRLQRGAKHPLAAHAEQVFRRRVHEFDAERSGDHHDRDGLVLKHLLVHESGGCIHSIYRPGYRTARRAPPGTMRNCKKRRLREPWHGIGKWKLKPMVRIPSKNRSSSHP